MRSVFEGAMPIHRVNYWLSPWYCRFWSIWLPKL